MNNKTIQKYFFNEIDMKEYKEALLSLFEIMEMLEQDEDQV
jgi:hypothetical protein